MGYFSAAYSVFMPVYAVSVTGLPAAAAKCTAVYASRGDESGAQGVKRCALRLFGLVGLAAMLVIMAAAVPFCKYSAQDMYALPAMAMIAPSVLAGCLVSVYRGFYEGMRNMYPTAVSQVIEGAAKLIFGLSICYGCIYLAENDPGLFLKITGCTGKGVDPTQAAVPYGAAAAVLGITLSTYTGLASMVIYDARQHKERVSCRGKEREILSELLKIALPASVGALVINLTSLIDLVTVMYSLKLTVKRFPSVYQALISAGISPEQIPNFIYGSFTGLAVTVFNLIPAITNMFGKSMLPRAAAAKASGDEKRLSECSCGVLIASALIALPSGFGIAFLGGDVLRFLFSGRELEISVCEGAMTVLGLSVPLVSMSSAGAAVLQASGRADIPVKIMGIGAAVKLAGNLILTPVPELGVTGAAMSTLVCYLVIFVLTIIAMKKHSGLAVKSILGTLFAIFSASVMCGAGAVFMKNAIGDSMGQRVSVLLSCAFGAIIYIIVTYFSGVITKKSLKLLIS